MFSRLLAIATCILFATPVAWAHPLDISASVFTIQGSDVRVSTFFHPFEVEYLLAADLPGDARYDLQAYFDHADTVLGYAGEHIQFAAGGAVCQFVPGDMPVRPDYEIVTDGIEVQYGFACPEAISDFVVDASFFIADFPLQTNQVAFYTPPVLGQPLVPFAEKVLTTKVTRYRATVGQTPAAMVDTDGDRIADEEEQIYKTDPTRPDTDGDYYTDGEEILYGWDPLNPELGPGQDARTSEDDMPLVAPAAPSTPSGGDVFQTGPLRDVLAQLNAFFASPTLMTGAVFFAGVFFLGFFHALSVGHGKTILASYLVDGNRSFADGVLFSLMLTATHLADVLLLGLLFKFFASTGFASELTAYLQIAGVTGLIALSLFLLVRAIRGLRAPLPASETSRPTLIMAFLLGLAPCSFGWAIFLVLLSLGQVAWVAPVLLAFGAGIFATLFMVAFVVSFIQRSAATRYRPLARYAPVVSGSLLVVVSLSLAYRLATGGIIS